MHLRGLSVAFGSIVVEAADQLYLDRFEFTMRIGRTYSLLSTLRSRWVTDIVYGGPKENEECVVHVPLVAIIATPVSRSPCFLTSSSAPADSLCLYIIPYLAAPRSSVDPSPSFLPML